jgi:hypothetical protein
MALNIYFNGFQALGCFLTCTATVDAATYSEIRKDINIAIHRVDVLIEKRLLKAQQESN